MALKSLYVKYSSCRPTEEEFLELASQGYAPAYIRAASMAEERGDLEKTAELLNKALQTGHEEASLSLIRVYKNNITRIKPKKLVMQILHLVIFLKVSSLLVP